MRTQRNILRTWLLIPVLALMSAASTTRAAIVTYTWSSATGVGTTHWNTNANWSSSTSSFPGAASSDIALFSNASGLNTTSNLSASVSIGMIAFGAVNNDTTSFGYHITADPGQAIALNNTGGGSSGAIYARNITGTNTIDASLFLAGAAGATQQFAQAGAGNMVINGAISANAGNSLALTGNFTLAATNTYTGNTIVAGNSTVLSVANINNAGVSGNLGAGTAINYSNNGKLRYTGSGEITTKGVTFIANTAGHLDGSGSGALNIAGNVTSTAATGTQTLYLNGDSALIQNQITGNITNGVTGGQLAVYAESGRWALSGNNTHTGGGTVGSTGNLAINSAAALGTGLWAFNSGAVIDNTSAAAITLTGNPTFNWNSFTFSGTKDLNLGAGAVTLVTATTTVTVAGGALTVDGAVNQTGFKNLTKSGNGKLVLNGNNTYTGITTITAGTLLINGNASAATGNLSVNSGGTLGGAGTIGSATATVNSGGTLSPGNSPGTLTFAGNLSLAGGAGPAGATAIFEGGDLVNVTGTLSLNTDWNLKLTSGFVNGGSVTLFAFGAAGGAFDLTPDIDITGLGFTPSGPLTLTNDGLGHLVLNGISVELMPEPGTLALLATGGLIVVLRRKNQRQ